MKLTVNSKEILKAAQSVGALIKTNSTLPVTENILLEIGSGKMKITADNLETRSSTEIDVSADWELKTLVNYDLISKMLKGLPDTSVEFDFTENVLKLSYANGNYQLPLTTPETFPTQRQFDSEQTIKMNALDLMEGFRKCLPFVDDKDPRVIQNLLIDIRKENVRIVSMNGGCGMYFAIDGGGSETQLLLRKSIASSLQSMILSDTEIDIYWTKNALFIKGEGIDISASLSEGQYPNYEAVFPVDSDKNLVVDSGLISSVKRLHGLTDKNTSTVAMDFDGGKCIMNYNSKDYQYDAKEEITVDYTGEPLRIGFNAGFLQNLLSACGENTVIGLSGEKRAAVFKSENMTAVLMPVILDK